MGGVRVKRCGKSAPPRQQCRGQGKPHTEQDQIGRNRRRRIEFLVEGQPPSAIREAKLHIHANLRAAPATCRLGALNLRVGR